MWALEKEKWAAGEIGRAAEVGGQGHVNRVLWLLWPWATKNNRQQGILPRKSWRFFGSMLIGNTRIWRTGGSCTKIMCVPILRDWCKNTSKTPMLNCHLTRCTRQISHYAIFGVPQEVSPWPSIFVSNNKVIDKIHTFFNSISRAKFEDNQSKMSWKNGTLFCEWDSIFWESTNQKKLIVNRKTAMNKFFFLLSLKPEYLT